MVLLVNGGLFALTSFEMLRISGQVRERETRLHQEHENLERLSELHKNFLHIAVHDIQSPVGVVTMLLNNVKEGLGGPLSEKRRGRVADVEHRQSVVVETLEQLRLGVQVALDVVMEVEVIVAQVGEDAGGEFGAVDSVQRQRM